MLWISGKICKVCGGAHILIHTPWSNLSIITKILFWSVIQICFLSFCRQSMWRHQVFWPRSCLCHPLQQLEVVLSTSKNSRGDWGHPAQFCHSCMGPLFQTGDSVGDDETRSGFLQNCSRELSPSFWCHDSKTLKRIRSRQPNKLRFSRFTSSSSALRVCKYLNRKG